MSAHLTAYRVMATIVGVLLVVLCLIGLPLNEAHLIDPAWFPVGSSAQELGDDISKYLGVRTDPPGSTNSPGHIQLFIAVVTEELYPDLVDEGEHRIVAYMAAVVEVGDADGDLRGECKMFR